MNTSPLPPPVASTPNARNPWKVFGIATIVVLVVGAAIGGGYFLGTSGDGSPTPPASTIQPPPSTLPEPPTTTAAVDADETALAAIAASEQRLDDIIVDFRGQMPVITGGSYRRAFDRADELFKATSTCDERAPALADLLDEREPVDDYLAGLRADLRTENERLLLYRRAPNSAVVQAASIEALRKHFDYDEEVNFAESSPYWEGQAIRAWEKSMEDNC